MIRFNNDYNHGAHPSILKALAATARMNGVTMLHLLSEIFLTVLMPK